MNTTVSLEFLTVRQADPIVQDMVDAIDKIRASDYSKSALDKIDLPAIINKRFKTNFTIDYSNDGFHQAAVHIPPMDKNHPFFAMFKGTNKQLIDKFYDLAKAKKPIGKVDLNKMELSGIFSEIPITMFLDQTFFKDKNVTQRQLTAIILHEIGHTFTHYFYLINTTMANFVTVAVSGEAMGAQSDKERTIIFEKGCIVLGLERIAVRDLLEQSAQENTSVLQGLYLAQMIDSVRSETSNAVYDLRACEQIADYFASRFNLAGDLATVLFHLDKTYNSIRTSTATTIAMEAVTAILCILLATNPFFIPTVLLFVIASIVSKSTVEINQYDNPKQRLITLKNYVIGDLKTANPNDVELIKSLISNLEKIIAKHDKISDYAGVFDWINRKFSSTRRQTKSIIDQQKQIESLIYNDTFIAAAKFQTLNKG